MKAPNKKNLKIYIKLNKIYEKFSKIFKFIFYFANWRNAAFIKAKMCSKKENWLKKRKWENEKMRKWENNKIKAIQTSYI